MCGSDREREREFEGVCECVCVSERDRWIERECVWGAGACLSLCACVSVRQSVCVSECV